MALPATNLTFHVDAADTDRLWKEAGMSNHPADTEEVLAWDDEGDATNFAYFGNTGTSPVYAAASFNGNGSLDFDGADNFLFPRTDNNLADQILSDIITDSAYTYFIAFIMEGDASNDATPASNDALIGDHLGVFGLFLKSSAGVHTMMALNFDGSTDHADVTIAQNTKYVACVKHVGGNISIDVNNGTLTATAASGGTTALLGKAYIGRASSPVFFNGKVGEVAIYNADVTGSDLSDAWAYFMAKWVTAAGSAVPVFMNSYRQRHT